MIGSGAAMCSRVLSNSSSTCPRDLEVRNELLAGRCDADAQRLSVGAEDRRPPDPRRREQRHVD